MVHAIDDGQSQSWSNKTTNISKLQGSLFGEESYISNAIQHQIGPIILGSKVNMDEGDKFAVKTHLCGTKPRQQSLADNMLDDNEYPVLYATSVYMN